MNIRPINNLIFVTPQDEVQTGLIVMPPGTKLEDKVYQGVVAAVGPTADGVKVGDRVLHGKWSGQLTKVEGVEYVVLKDSDLLCVVEEVTA